MRSLIGFLIHSEGVSPLGEVVPDKQSPAKGTSKNESEELSESSNVSDNWISFDQELPAEWLKPFQTKSPPEVLLSSENLLFQNVTLPSKDRSELQDMIELQAETLSPYPAEQSLLAWELLKQEGDHSDVLVILGGRQHVDKLKPQLKKKQLLPTRMDASPCAWLEGLRQRGHIPKQGAFALWLLPEGESPCLILGEDQQPLLIRSPGLEPQPPLSLLEQELEQALQDFELEQGPLSSGPLLIMLPKDSPLEVSEHAERLDADPEILLSGLKERVDRTETLNLCPPDWLKERQQELQLKGRLRSLISLAAVWVLCMGLLMGSTQLQKNQLDAMKGELRILQPQLEELAQLQETLRDLETFSNRDRSSLQMMKYIAERIPSDGNLHILDFLYQKSKGLSFSGQLDRNQEPFFRLVEALAEHPDLDVEDYNLKQQRGITLFQIDSPWAWIKDEEASDS